MYTRDQASKIKQQFWTSFGKYMAPVLSAEGEKINWINYKTGIRHLNFKMDATKEEAYISIEIVHKVPAYAQKLFDQFVLLKSFLALNPSYNWQWEPAGQNGNPPTISRIITKLQPCNIFNEKDWPAIISFLKPGIIWLDKFWCTHKIIFEMIA